MKQTWLPRAAKLVFVALVVGCSNDDSPQVAALTDDVPLCARTPRDRVCSFLPQDVDVELFNAYQGLVPQFQRPFDVFSWQMFVALNWPAARPGMPPAASIADDPQAPRVWMGWATPYEVSGAQPDGRGPAPGACSGVAPAGSPILPIYPETDGVNAAFRQALAGTVWANYRLINAQWQSKLDAPPFTLLSIPRYLGNPALETYIQGTSDCLGCHTAAQTADQRSANLSFVLSYAK